MIAKFETGSPAAQTAPGTGKGMNTLVILAVVAVVAYLGYKYVIKPEVDKQKEEANKQ